MAVNYINRGGRRYKLNDSGGLGVFIPIPPSSTLFTMSYVTGTQTANGTRSVITFNANGLLGVTGSGNIEILVIGGGGAGGWDRGGGGGAGGFLWSASYAVTAGAYVAQIGVGGTGGNTQATSGNSSSIFTLSVPGGGRGASSKTTRVDPATGSSGGGGYGQAPFYGAPGISPFGFGGGAGTLGSANADAGGGGGAGEAGKPSSATMPGAGGTGSLCNITAGGAGTYYAGGGGAGGFYAAHFGLGGPGGGGSGSKVQIGAGEAGWANTGGGGGAGGGNGGNAGPGGSGVIIISYEPKT